MTTNGPNPTGLLAVHVSLGALWRPPFQSAHLCPPAIFSGPEWYTTFRGPNPGPERNSVSEPESGPESNNFSRPGALGCACFSRGSLEATVSICAFVSTSHLFGARMVYDFSGSESGTRMEQLFGARIGARIEQLFGVRGSWLWMFLQGLFGGHRFNLHICVHQPSFRGPNGIRLFGARIRDPNGTAFRGPNRGPNRTTFRGPGLLAVDVSPGALWRPPFQSAHLCPPAIFSGPEWNDFLGPEPSARMERFFEARMGSFFLW